MNLIDTKYAHLCTISSDINEHLPTLKRYASGCESVTEFGVRAIVSTWALLAGHPAKMISVDIVDPSDNGASIHEVYDACSEAGIDYQFIKADTLGLIIPTTDLLFLDTLHTYEHVKKELHLHGDAAKKFIIIHDTEHNRDMVRAIDAFVGGNPWEVAEVFTNNNGLTVLRRNA